MAKIYVIVSTLVLLASLLFSPLLFRASSPDLSVSTVTEQTWVAGPFGEGK
jgi:hypothetical protein